MARRSIPVETRNAVLAAAQLPDANLPEIAKQFGVSLPTVYNYLKAARVVETIPESVQA